ncbi:hypothetical protein TGARI_366260 [Toxoplasma gondii ARI]|uniref:Uncharacterized protein n=2 Tax=Toxoplasma gondii TaxID=5811 RepID=V4ZPS9_TOXGV|nr:hypothetical protein TGVEG_366260 [Toxoplasma gondii VEG]KYF46025.1 hypothetical protein TGARI_366260 [Toxoplasma gondii ARI]
MSCLNAPWGDEKLRKLTMSRSRALPLWTTAERRQISLCFPRDILLRIENVRRAKEAPSQQPRKISGARYRQSQGDGATSEKSPTSKPFTRKPLRRPLQASDESRPSTEHSCTGASVELPQPDTFLDGDENVVCCQLPPSTQMLSWFLRKWATPHQYPLEKDLRDEDNISEEVAIYWSAGPTLLRDLKEAILTSDILCYLGDALERYSERNSKSTYDVALPTACPTSCTAEFLSVLSVLLPSDQSPSGSVSAGSQNVDEVDDDSDVEEATTARAPRRSSIVTQQNSAGAGNSLHLALLVGGIANEANCQGISADAINCLSNDEGTSFMRVCRGHHVQLLSPADSILLDLK